MGKPEIARSQISTLARSPLQAIRKGIVILGLLGLSACAASDAQTKPQDGKRPPVPVIVAKVTRKTVPLQFRTTGTVEAYSTVAVKSQVAGQLTEVHFQEGQEVRQGQPLFTIDPRPQQAALMQSQANRAKSLAQVKQAEANLQKAIAQVGQAKATLAKDAAQARNADAQAQRYSSLFAQGAISRDQVDQYRTTAASQRAVLQADQEAIATAQAGVEAAKADVNNAIATVGASDAEVDTNRIQLSYNSILAPIDGRTSSLNVDQGNLVKENDTNPLVVISQIRPIYVKFAVPQRLLPDLKKYQSRGRLGVTALIPNDERRPIRGQLTFSDSSVDTTTGTLQLKGQFTNAEGRLTPGQFVNVELKLAEESNALVVPTTAVQIGQKGQVVYVLKSDQTVEMRPVVVGTAIANETVIKEGLSPDEQVVVDGQFNLAPGAAVKVKDGLDSPQKQNKDKNPSAAG